jgi:nucleoside phosphorylase/tetratricopeptide (TPR) repeat protein
MNKSNKHKNENPSAPIDFVIITALEEEREAMLSKLRGFKKLDKESDDIYTYYFAKVKSQRRDGSIYQIVVACPLNMGPLNATALSIALVQKWKPRFVILVGIACGIKDEVNYGDVMIATQVADYTLAKQEDGMRKVRWEVYPSGPSLLDSANNIDSKWTSKIVQQRPSEGNVVSVKGVIASGGDVISDDQVIKTYSESWPKLIGIEMESGGIAGGLHRTPDRPEFLMVKSVSDFGKDKHDPEVKPWRNYACHTAAAFTLGLIKSGPAQSSLLIQEKTKDIEAEKERKEAAERRWQYVQNHPITSIDVKLYLKSSVGFDWFKQILDDIRIFFSREKSGLKLSYVLKKSCEPNTKEFDRKSDVPISSFWEMYELESGYWCKRIKPIVKTFKLVAGFDSSIPWSFLNAPEVKKLKDLASLEHIGISVPPQLFHAGIEELIFRINGETFSFSVYCSDHALEFYHEMANTFHSIQSISGKEGPPMFFSFGFEGVQLLDMFHKQMMPEYRHTRKKEGIFGGQSGPNGNAISFYPSIPTGFNKTEESKEYVFTISAPKEIDYPKLVSELEKLIEADETNAENYLKLATIYAVQGRFQDVINCLTAAISKVKPNWELYGLLGDAYYKLGRYDDALVDFNTAASLAPDNPKVQIGLGLTLQGLGEDNAALSHFENAVRLDPSNHFGVSSPQLAAALYFVNEPLHSQRA